MPLAITLAGGLGAVPVTVAKCSSVSACPNSWAITFPRSMPAAITAPETGSPNVPKFAANVNATLSLAPPAL